MCLAIPGKIVSIRRRCRHAHGARRFRRRRQGDQPRLHAGSRGRRLRARPCRLRHHRHRRGRGGTRSSSISSASARSRTRRLAAGRPANEVPRRISRSGRRRAASPRRSRRTVTRPWKIMEVCGGQTHAIVRYGIDQLLPHRGHADPRARLPGLRHAGRLYRQGDRDRRPARGRSSARSATCCACPAPTPTCSPPRPRGGDVRVVYSPLDALDDRPRQSRIARSSSSPSASRPPRRPTPWPPIRPSARASRNFSMLVSPRPGAAGDARHPLRPDQPRAGLPRRRPCLHHHGLSRNMSRSPPSTRCRSWSPASSRSTSSKASTSDRAAARGGPRRGREPLRPRGAAGPATRRRRRS